MAKFRQGDLVLQSGQKIIQGGTEVLAASGALENVASFQFQSGVQISEISDSTSLGTSDAIVSTQNAVKAYVDSQVGGAVPAGTDESVVRYNGTSSVHESLLFIDDSGNVTGVNDLTAGGVIYTDFVEAPGSVLRLDCNPSGLTGSVYIRAWDNGESQLENLFTGSPNGVSLYADDGIALQTDVEGIHIKRPNSSFSCQMRYTGAGLFDVTSNSAGQNVRIRGRDAGDTTNPILIEADPDGAVSIYFAGDKSIETGNGFLDVFDADASDNLRIAHGGTHASIRNTTDSGLMYINGTNSGSSSVNLFSGNPDGGSSMYYQGTAVVQAASNGMNVVHPSSTTPRVNLQNNSAQLVGRVWSSGDDMYIDAGINAAGSDRVILRAWDGSSAYDILFQAIQGGAAQLYYNGASVAATTANGITGAVWG